MAKSDNIRGVESISIGAPGDGVVGSTLTEYTKIVVSSLSLTGKKVTRDSIPLENIANYMSVKSGSDPATVAFKLVEVSGEDLVDFAGGSWDNTTKTYSAPIEDAQIHLSVVIKTIPVNGTYAEITFPYGFTIAAHDGTITENDLLSVDFNVTADIPETALGVQGAPYTITWKAVA